LKFTKNTFRTAICARWYIYVYRTIVTNENRVPASAHWTDQTIRGNSCYLDLTTAIDEGKSIRTDGRNYIVTRICH